jgi:sulfane dehydrogenase subunit SoxC
VKSFITNPSPGMGPKAAGYVEISGVAYSGTGRIARVMVSADGGASWGEAALQEPTLSKAYALALERRAGRFAEPSVGRSWERPADACRIHQAVGQTKSPATWPQFPSHHYNAVASWAVDAKREVRNVYA